MKVEFLPVPKSHAIGNGQFRLHSGLNVFVNKAKVQDHVIDLFGFLWRNYKVNMKIVAIRDRDFKEEYERGFFLYATADEALPDSFSGILVDTLSQCQEEGYRLNITPQCLFICSPTTRGFYNGVLTLQQASDALVIKNEPGSTKIELAFPEMDVLDHPDLALRAVHVDLKRQLHSLDYIKDYIRMLARFKVNAIVWEWEDKFPFKRRPEIKHPLAFNSQEATELIELCRAHGIEAIPLVQTYGHLEFVLKRDRYAHLKEEKGAEYDPYHTLDACAMEDETMRVIEDMIADVVSYHHRSRYIHVGGDEVYTIGTCVKCKKYVDEHGQGDAVAGKSKLYVTHMNKVIKVVKGYGKIPMLWHDYLLKYPACIDELDKDAVVVYWMYGKDRDPSDFSKEIGFFKKKGFKVLVASSVNSDFQYAIPNYDLRLQNIHELNRALAREPEGSVGSLATNWACCRAPMETSIPAVLFFADASWNTGDAPYSLETFREFAPRLLRRLFMLEAGQLHVYTKAFELLVGSTSNPNHLRDVGRLDSLLGDAIAAWKQLAGEARSSRGVAENILHGLRLQRLKVQVILLSRQVEKLFDIDNPPLLGGISALESDVKLLAREFETQKISTKSLYEKVMYDEEVVEELGIRFTSPLTYLAKLSSSISSIREGLQRLASLVDSCTPFVHDGQQAGVLSESALAHDALVGALRGWLQGTHPLPLPDALERYRSMLGGLLDRASASTKGQIVGLSEALRAFSSEVDSFLLENARNAMEGNFLGRF